MENESLQTQDSAGGEPMPPHDRVSPEKKHSPLKNALILLAAGAFALFFCVTPPDRFPRGGIITIAPGETIKEISMDLKRSGYIRSQFLFVNLVILSGGEKSLSQGDYYFENPISVFGVAKEISSGNHHLDQIKITIPEGKSVSEISDIFKLKLSAFDTTVFKQEGSQYEGYLFPETYFVYPRTDAVTIINQMRDMYTKEAKPLIKKDNPNGYSERDIVIMASIIEKEARGDDDRAVVSGILWNRLAREIPLQVDATVAYAKGIPENALTSDDLGFDSPYNTYIYRGLPPGPISNPGTLALEAAMNPAQTPYLYYLHDKHGTIHYAKTYVEHQKNITTYLR